jgi:hypothetical protein
MVLGCSSSNSQALVLESQTLVAVEPADFVDDGTCGKQLKTYVATLFDDTGPTGLSDAGVSSGRFLVASSPPKPCSEATVFSRVIAGHAYSVELQGYQQPASDLSPAYSGSSAMLLNTDSSYVAPFWTATCHGWTDNDGMVQPGYSYGNATVTLHECTKLGATGS